MSSEFGKHIRYSIFGESHGPAIGVVIDGLPAGEPIDMAGAATVSYPAAPGQGRMTTARKEPDQPEFLSGLLEGKTTERRYARLSAIQTHIPPITPACGTFRGRPIPTIRPFCIIMASTISAAAGIFPAV